MADLVPVIDFIHALRSVGVSVNYWDVVDRPREFWDRLSPSEREALLEEMRVTASPARVSELTIVRRRGKAPVHDNVYLRIATDEEKGLPGTLHKARDFVTFQAFKESPKDGERARVGLPGLNVMKDHEFEEFNTPQSISRDMALVEARRAVIEVLDAAWGGQPYNPIIDGVLLQQHTYGNMKELDRYWVEEPFALVTVLRSEENELVYHIEEPRLSDLEKALMVTVNERLRDALVTKDEEPDDRALHLAEEVFDLVNVYRQGLKRSSAYKLGYYFLRNYLGFARLEPVMRDSAIEDVSSNGPHVPVYVVHGKHGNMPTSLVFGELELMNFTTKLAQRGGKLLSVAQPLVDATLPDGSRIQASLGKEVTSRGSAFTIRKFKDKPLTCVDLINGGTHSLDSMAFLWLAVEMKANIVVMGATASGKTTTMNVLSQFIPPVEKIVSIEDTREIKLEHENWLAATTRESFTANGEDRISMYDLLRAALRQRPDYVLVGEIRGEEGLTLFQAMSTGHTCFSTMHAGSVENAVYRMENPPINVPRVMLTSLDFFLLQGQVDVNGRPKRRMLSLTEINGLDSGTRNLRTNEIFRWEGATDTLGTVAQSHALDRARQRLGWSRARLEREFQARRAVIADLVERNERSLAGVSRAIARFYASLRIWDDDVGSPPVLPAGGHPPEGASGDGDGPNAGPASNAGTGPNPAASAAAKAESAPASASAAPAAPSAAARASDRGAVATRVQPDAATEPPTAGGAPRKVAATGDVPRAVESDSPGLSSKPGSDGNPASTPAPTKSSRAPAGERRPAPSTSLSSQGDSRAGSVHVDRRPGPSSPDAAGSRSSPPERATDATATATATAGGPAAVATSTKDVPTRTIGAAAAGHASADTHGARPTPSGKSASPSGTDASPSKSPARAPDATPGAPKVPATDPSKGSGVQDGASRAKASKRGAIDGPGGRGRSSAGDSPPRDAGRAEETSRVTGSPPVKEAATGPGPSSPASTSDHPDSVPSRQPSGTSAVPANRERSAAPAPSVPAKPDPASRSGTAVTSSSSTPGSAGSPSSSRPPSRAGSPTRTDAVSSSAGRRDRGSPAPAAGTGSPPSGASPSGAASNPRKDAGSTTPERANTRSTQPQGAASPRDPRPAAAATGRRAPQPGGAHPRSAPSTATGTGTPSQRAGRSPAPGSTGRQQGPGAGPAPASRPNAKAPSSGSPGSPPTKTARRSFMDFLRGRSAEQTDTKDATGARSGPTSSPATNVGGGSPGRSAAGAPSVPRSGPSPDPRRSGGQPQSAPERRRGGREASDGPGRQQQAADGSAGRVAPRELREGNEGIGRRPRPAADENAGQQESTRRAGSSLPPSQPPGAPSTEGPAGVDGREAPGTASKRSANAAPTAPSRAAPGTRESSVGERNVDASSTRNRNTGGRDRQ